MTTRVTLRPDPPFRLDLTVWALRRRARNVIDSWDGERYSRLLEIDGAPALIVISQISPPSHPELEILCIDRGHGAAVQRLTEFVRRLLGLDVGLADFYKLAATNARLEALAKRFAGFRPPRFPTVFEAAVNAVCCQQLSLEVGLELLNRLAATAGAKTTHNGTTFFAFPQPRGIARLSEERLRGLGFSRQKAATLLALATILSGDESFLERLTEHDEDAVRSQLLELKGIGRWSAEYIMLRGLGRLDIFPADDIAAQKNLQRWLAIGSGARQSAYERIHRALRKWRPYQGLVYFHLLLAGLADRGLIESSAQQQRLA